jgi:PIN domain nuclease of toxin-antitoxin system
LRYLLDTHIWLWGLLAPARLAPAVRAKLAAPEAELWLSAATFWEVMILAQRKGLNLEMEPALWIRTALERQPVRESPIDRQIAVESRLIDLPTADPADRFLAATAIVHDLTLVTADERLLRSRQFKTLANR